MTTSSVGPRSAASSVAEDRVFVENRTASFRAVRHLLDISHTRIAVLTGNIESHTGRERFKGYRQAMLGRGLSIDPDLVLETHWSEEEAFGGMLKLLTLREPPTAVYCCNYNMTVGALRMIKEHGLRIPDDNSLVSFDDIPLFGLYEVGITAVAQPSSRSPRPSPASSPRACRRAATRTHRTPSCSTATSFYAARPGNMCRQ